MQYVFFACVAIIVGLTIVIVYLAYKADKQRTDDLHQVAEDMGFEFASDPGQGALKRHPGLYLFAQGRKPDVRNQLCGKANGLDVCIFDYSYVTGGGKSRHTWRQTVLTFEIDDANLPTFSLRPEHVFHKIASWFGYQDINFETHPRFSKLFLLRGEDENAVRKIFSERVLDYYEENPGVCTEGSRSRLVYYRAQTRVDPAEVRTFLEEGFRVLALFRASNQE
jgi:hypothetical protein